MAIRKLGRNKFFIRVYAWRDPITKSRHDVSETFRGTRAAAEKREQVMKAEVRKRQVRGSPNITVSEYIDLYLEATANRRSELSNLMLREMFDRYVVPYIGGLCISKVDTSVIQQLLNFLYAPKKEGHK